MQPYGWPSQSLKPGRPVKTSGIGRPAEACRPESLCVPGSCKIPGPHSEARLCDKHDTKGGQVQIDRGVGKGGREVSGSGPIPQQGSMVPDEGVVLATFDRAPPPPTQVTLDRITAERVDLYRHVPPLGENTPVSVEPFQVEKLVPPEENIQWAVKRLQDHHSGAPQKCGQST